MYKVYVVSKGDTVNLIATKFRTTPQELRQINGFPENYEVEFGQTIIVPAAKDNLFTTYIVKQGDTIYGIANKLGVGYKDLAALNGLDETEYIYPNQQITVPKEKTVFYISKENDTLKKSIEDKGEYEVVWSTDSKFINPQNVVGKTRKELGL
jgi:LysM repeat protein